MAAQPAVKPQMLSAASTASQQDVIKENYEKVGEGFRLEKSFIQGNFSFDIFIL